MKSTRRFKSFLNTGNARTLQQVFISGSRSLIEPYAFNGDFVEYRGNEGTLRSYVDLQRLFETNLSGVDVFGGISTPVQGSADLSPHLTEDTLLSTLNGGDGISRGAALRLPSTPGHPQ